MRRRPLPVLTVGAALLLSTGAYGQEPAAPLASHTLIEADSATYEGDIVTAAGNVMIAREGNVLTADRVVYDRARDVATATGNVTLIDANGTAMFVERIDVTGDLKQGLARELRVLMADKSRMTARAFRRVDETMEELYETAYTACDVCDDRAPVWKLEARKVRRNTEKRMVYYNDVWLDFLGIPVFYSPYLAHPDPTAGRKTGLLMPSIGGGANLGLFYAQPFYINIAPDKDATLEPMITTSAGKGVRAEYRQDFQHGRFYFYASGVGGDPATPDDFRGHVASWARWDIDDHWRTGAEINLSSDQTYLRRYNLESTSSTWLTTSAFAERFDRNSYFSAASYYFQRQRNVIAQPSPVIAPLLTYNYTSDPLSWGGYLKFDASAVVLARRSGNDSNRLSAIGTYDLPFTTSGGHVFQAHLAYRVDGYHITDYTVPTTGRPFTGTVGRTHPEASVEWRYPLVRPGKTFTQVFEPIAMIYASPVVKREDRIPNEDSRDFEFDDTNLFAHERFTGFDRIEGGTRLSYGLHWAAYNTQGGTISALIGQSYRLNRASTFPAFSGLDSKTSDYVGRIDVSPNQYLSFQYRFRLDKDNFTSRRSEIGATFGPEMLKLAVTYVDVTPRGAVVSPLDRPKEIFTAATARIDEYWRITARHRHKLGPGGGAIRTEALLQYEDECFAFDLTVAKDNTSDRDFRSGTQVLLRFSLKTLGDLRINTQMGRP